LTKSTTTSPKSSISLRCLNGPSAAPLDSFSRLGQVRGDVCCLRYPTEDLASEQKTRVLTNCYKKVSSPSHHNMLLFQLPCYCVIRQTIDLLYPSSAAIACEILPPMWSAVAWEISCAIGNALAYQSCTMTAGAGAGYLRVYPFTPTHKDFHV